MAPQAFAARDSICGAGWRYNGRVCVRSGWYNWGRWILAGVLILAAILFFLCFSMRRQRRGAAPMYGTGWLGGHKHHHPQQQPPPSYPPPPGPYPYGDPNQQPPYGAGGYAEPYGQQPVSNHMTGETFSPNDGYYAGQQYGVQAPPNAYQPQPYPPK